MPTSRRIRIKRKHRKGQARAKVTRPKVARKTRSSYATPYSKGRSKKAAKRGRGKVPP